VSPPGEQGLAVHHDQTEIITLQVSGSKVWNLYEPVAPDIMPDKPHVPSGPPRLVAAVSAGDTLYVPRGHVHRVISQDQPSLSAAITFQSFAWSALISLIYEKATEDEALSESIPARALDHLTEEEISSRLKRLTNLASQLSPEDVRAFLRANRYSLPARKPESHLSATFSPERVTADSIVRRRSGVAAHIELQDDGAVIRATGLLPLRLPAKAVEAARALIEAEKPIRVRDLPSRLSADAKGNLARKLLRLGLIATETD